MNITDIINPYSYIMKLRRLLYRQGTFRSVKVTVPVISIGNLSVGGTGKTPLALFLAGYISETLSKRTAIILRGYKRQSSGYLLVSDGNIILENVLRSGDEAQLYAQELPQTIVICDEDRIRGAKNAIELGAEVILLDDGFQHLRLQRDLNILLINSAEGIPPVMPFGRGREDSSAISDADIIILTNSGGENNSDLPLLEIPIVRSKTVFTSLELILSNEDVVSSLSILHGEKIIALSGIANPESFEKSLSMIAGSVIPFRLEDHAEYDIDTLRKLAFKAKAENCKLIVTTTKDAVKMLDTYRTMLRNDTQITPLAVVQSEIEFTGGEEILFKKINNLFQS